MRYLLIPILLVVSTAANAQATDGCGEVVTIPTHSGTTTRYAFAPAKDAKIGLVMLIGGGGYMNLDDQGCPRLLSRNVLVRMRPLLNEAGIVTALVDAPSDMKTEEGLGGFRIASGHAEDLGKVIAELRARINGPVGIVGHSRGSLSAANTAARLTGGPNAPDGVILMSPMLVGDHGARKAWVAHTVFSTNLSDIKVPVLVIGHAADNCVRSPGTQISEVLAKTKGTRQQAATVTGGPIAPGRAPSVAACEPREPHDFVDQQDEVAAGIVRFMRSGNY